MTNTPCFRCERPVRRTPQVWHVHYVEDNGNDLGWYPIGADCARILRAEGAEVERLAVTA